MLTALDKHFPSNFAGNPEEQEKQDVTLIKPNLHGVPDGPEVTL